MATNQLLTFAVTSGANVLSQTSYAALTARGTGFISGIASSAAFNKAMRQAAFTSAMIGQFAADNSGNDTNDDGDTATYLTNFETAVTNVASTAIGTALSDYLPLAGGTMTGQITLPGNPSETLQAATKGYVDNPGLVIVSSATTLTSQQYNKLVKLTGSTGYTVTLPDPSTGSGGGFSFYNVSNADKTLSTPAGQFTGPGGSGTSTHTIPAGAYAHIVAGETYWIVLSQTHQQINVTGATTLGANCFNGYVQLGGATTYTVTLPDPTYYHGAGFTMYNSGSINYTVATPSGTFKGPSASGNSTQVVYAGEFWILRSANANWVVGKLT